MCLHARIRRMVALMLLLHVMFYSLYDARIVVLIPNADGEYCTGVERGAKRVEAAGAAREGTRGPSQRPRRACTACVWL